MSHMPSSVPPEGTFSLEVKKYQPLTDALDVGLQGVKFKVLDFFGGFKEAF